MEKVNFNGTILPADTPLYHTGNRAFRYGDGIFETIRVFEGKIPFLPLHFNRLLSGLQLLKFEIPEIYSTHFFETEIQKLVDGKGNHRIRLTVFRSDGGFYLPLDNRPQFLIESEMLEHSKFILNETGLKTALFENIRLPVYPFSNIKTCNALPFVLASIFCKENGLGDCFLLNHSGFLAGSSNANIFLIIENAVLTPALAEGCVDGTMRKAIISIAKNEGFVVKETRLNISDIHRSEEIWLSNAIQGIRWVGKFDNKQFTNKIAKHFVQLLNESITTK